MSIEELLDLMEDQLDEATGVPFSGKRIVDAEKFQEIMDEIRLNLPSELHQAKLIVSDRDEIIDGAHKEADEIVRKAEERARAIVSEESIVKAAEQRANEIVSEAQGKAREMRTKVYEYCDSILTQTGEQLVKSAGEVRKVKDGLRTRKQG